MVEIDDVGRQFFRMVDEQGGDVDFAHDCRMNRKGGV
jgi:hypothetical protein